MRYLRTYKLFESSDLWYYPMTDGEFNDVMSNAIEFTDDEYKRIHDFLTNKGYGVDLRSVRTPLVKDNRLIFAIKQIFDKKRFGQMRPSFSYTKKSITIEVISIPDEWFCFRFMNPTPKIFQCDTIEGLFKCFKNEIGLG